MYSYPISRFPRFGYGSDFAKLASNEQEEQVDYVLGILAVSYFIISLFILWTALIIMLKRMGTQRVGLCSGRVYVECDEKGQFIKPPKYIRKIRVAFIFFGLCMMSLSIALAGPGLASLTNTSSSMRSLTFDANEFITSGLVIMDKLQRVKKNLGGLDLEKLLMFEEQCPKKRHETTLLSTSSIRSIDEDFELLQRQLLSFDLEGMRQQIDAFMNGTKGIENAVNGFEKNDWIVKMVILFFGVLTFFMIIQSCLAWNGGCRYLSKLRVTSEYIILPLFTFGIACCWIVTAALAFAGIINADFCSDGPAGTLTNMFEERGITHDHIIYAAFTYYQSGCVTDDPIIHLYQYEEHLQNGVGAAKYFLDKVDEFGVDELSRSCGANVTPIVEGIGIIHDNLELLLDALRSTFSLASCSTVRPILTQAFDKVICTDSYESLTLIPSLTFAIALIGIIMLMMRSAMYTPQKVYFEEVDIETGDIYVKPTGPLALSSPPDSQFLDFINVGTVDTFESSISRSSSFNSVEINVSSPDFLASLGSTPNTQTPKRNSIVPRKLWTMET